MVPPSPVREVDLAPPTGESRELYIHEVAEHGGPPLGFDAVWAGCRTQLVADLSWWTPTLSRSVDFDFHDQQGTLEVIRRVTTAIDDHHGGR